VRNAAALACSLILAAVPVGLAAQDSLVHATIDSGTLVRMHPATGAPVRGRLVRPLTPSSTFVHYCRYPAPPCTNPADTTAIQQVSTTTLQRLEVQRGSQWATGALTGGLVGAGLGLLVGLASNSLCEDSSGCGPGTGVYMLSGAVLFGGLGAMIGSGSIKWGPAP